MVRLLVALLLLSGSVARADDDPDTEAARRHFQRASELYDAHRYREAVREFEVAKKLKPLPEFDFNIGRAYDRLEDWPHAIEAYQQYLLRARNEADIAEVRARLAVLQARVPQSPTATPEQDDARRARLRIAAYVDGSLALAAAIAGAGLVGSVNASYNSLHQVCSTRPCTPSDWHDAQTRATAAYALFAVAGAAEIVDIALFVRAYRHRPTAHVQVASSGAGLVAGATF
jgi:tetratricopeptide (TPR) repeat protein